MKNYIIAEMACSHDGSAELARKIIGGAGQAKADAVQFQIWTLADMMVPDHPAYEAVKKLELSREQWRELTGYTREHYPDMHIIACVYEEGSVGFAQEMGVDAYKIHSADLSNPRLMKHVAATCKRIDLSVGASTVEEIQNAVQWIKQSSDSEIWMMYGYQSFPTPIDGIHLNYMMKLRDLFELPVGYQDHSDADSDEAFWLPACAIGMGVNVLEKHITHDRSLKGADHESALNPDEFQKFVRMVRNIETAKGIAVPKPFTEEEENYRKYSKKSIVAARHLPKGKMINEDDLLFMRASELGFPPDHSLHLVGKKTRRDLQAYELVNEDMFCD